VFKSAENNFDKRRFKFMLGEGSKFINTKGMEGGGFYVEHKYLSEN
jgi:hypothetical protein